MLRHLIVAFMYSASYMLLVNEAIWPAFVSQLIWIALESNLCQDTGLVNLRNFVIQLLILSIICANMCCSSEKCQIQKPVKADA